MATKYISPTDCELLLILPPTLYTPAQTVDVTKFVSEGVAIEYDYINSDRIATIGAVDGTAEAFKSPDKRRYVQFTLTPANELSILLSQFYEADSENLVGVLFKDKINKIQYNDEKVTFRKTTPSQLTTTPEGVTYRLELLSPVVNFIE